MFWTVQKSSDEKLTLTLSVEWRYIYICPATGIFAYTHALTFVQWITNIPAACYPIWRTCIFERESFPTKKVTCPSDCGSDRDDTRPYPFHPRPVCLSSDHLSEFVTRCARKIPDRRRGDILLMYTSRPPRSSCPAQVSGVACCSWGGQVRQEEVKCVMWGSYFGLWVWWVYIDRLEGKKCGREW